ncbi:acyl-CoA thioesterase [Camelliibacillus cellulosilyticus]|uniref:Acyl-CoA thioesterase n=1 Tax=Camelliibacillus cellulosilyticus TaxID=2174486 RepID=A0ABV9GSA1_9BACL
MLVALEVIVRSTEIDVNGHVNNAKYLEYLEWGREEWYERNGLTYQAFLEMGIQTVTVNININYRKECTQGDQLTIQTTPERIGRTSYVLRQEIVNQNGDLCADALVTSVTMDAESRKSRAVPEQLRRLFDSGESSKQ